MLNISERLQTEKQRAKDSIREAEDMKQKEVCTLDVSINDGIFRLESFFGSFGSFL